ncbi:MAG: UDP-3-O-(3-hydroxymyristoyl)glucosamine N-acyltransferase [Spirochaetota bacterium]
MKLSEIAGILNEEYAGADVEIDSVGSLESVSANNKIIYIENAKFLEKAKSKNPAALVIPRGLNTGNIPFIESDDPRLVFIRLLGIFNPSRGRYDSGCADIDAIISEQANIDISATVMAGAVIMEGANVGANCFIYPNCVLESNCSVGSGTILYSGVVMRERCTVGNECILHSGTVIGSDGFGFYKKDNEIIKIPQTGIVKIGDRVEIGANCAIDRATVDKTEIGNDTKLDNLVHIAHNVKIGQKCFILAQTVIGGSATIGSNVIISGQVAVADHVVIPDNTIIMGQSAIHNNIKKADIFAGTPARPAKEHHRIFAALKYLPELLKRVKVIEDKINKR